MIQGNFLCTKCGTYHSQLTGMCQNNPLVNIGGNYFSYKCPKCRGEFNVPARNNLYENPKCPFCGYWMIGL